MHDPDRGVPVGLETVQVRPPGLDVTVNELGSPPDELAPVTVTLACSLPAETDGAEGALGASPAAPNTHFV